MSPRKRKLKAEDGEAPTAKKSIIEHGQLGGLLDQTILTILSRATGPMPRCNIIDEVATSLDGNHIMQLGQLARVAFGTWASLARGRVINGAARKWFTETKLIPPEGFHGDDDRWTVYQITDLGREREKSASELKEHKCLSEDILESKTNQDSIESQEKVLSTPELLSHIFSFLDYRDLQVCSNVSMQWKAVVARYYFNDNLGNSPRIVREAVYKNSATLNMKRLRFDCPGIKLGGGGRVMDVQRDGDRTLVAVKRRKVLLHLNFMKDRYKAMLKLNLLGDKPVKFWAKLVTGKDIRGRSR